MINHTQSPSLRNSKQALLPQFLICGFQASDQLLCYTYSPDSFFLRLDFRLALNSLRSSSYPLTSNALSSLLRIEPLEELEFLWAFCLHVCLYHAHAECLRRPRRGHWKMSPPLNVPSCRKFIKAENRQLSNRGLSGVLLSRVPCLGNGMKR